MDGLGCVRRAAMRCFARGCDDRDSGDLVSPGHGCMTLGLVDPDRQGRIWPPCCAGILRPMASLSREDVAHVAHLARLGLSEDEISRLHGQLDHILDQYTVLATLDTDGIPPTAQTIEVETILREDVVMPGLTVDEALAGAPERIGDHLVVPAILGGADD